MTDTSPKPERKKVPPDPALVARNEAMLDMWTEGYTLDEIGTHFSVTRERVRQLIPAGSKRKVSVSDRRDAEWADQYGDVVRRIAPGLGSYQAIADVIGQPRDRVRTFMRAHDIHASGQRRSEAQGFSEAQLMSAIRAGYRATRTRATQGAPFRGKEYDEWVAGQNDEPVRVTIVKRLGTWSQACVAAGVPAESRQRIRTVTEARCIDAMGTFLRAGVGTSGQAYINYREANPELNLPSRKSISDALGRWSHALEAGHWYNALLKGKEIKRSQIDFGPQETHSSEHLALTGPPAS